MKRFLCLTFAALLCLVCLLPLRASASSDYDLAYDATDRMDSAGALIDRYRAQLSLYKETVEDILQLPVRETWLYGFSEGLGEIRIPE